MLNKLIKLVGITLVGVGLFASLPFVSYAYTYGYNASVSTDGVTNISPMNATFNGSVSTGGISGDAWFQYGTDMNFGNSTSLNSYLFNSAYSGEYSTNVSGLSGNTTYYVRAVAQNSYGIVYGNVVSFTTAFSNSGYNNSNSPTAITTSGAVLANNTAQFNALILTGNTNSTNTWFEWGTTPAMGNQTTLVPIGGAPAIRHTNTITGLSPGTAYYFRAVAQNSYGISDGTILSLVTSGSTQNNIKTVNTKIISTDSTSVDHTVNTNNSSILSTLGANVFGAGSFFPVNLFGWLMLIILILILVLLSKHVHREFTQKKDH